jgi:hypothetical protein
MIFSTGRSKMGFFEDRMDCCISLTPFSLSHPSFEGRYRWKATLFRHRMTDEDNQSQSPNEELFFLYRGKRISSDAGFLLKGDSQSSRFDDLLKRGEFPEFTDPTVYIEVHRIQKEKPGNLPEPGYLVSELKSEALKNYNSTITSKDMRPGNADWESWKNCQLVLPNDEDPLLLHLYIGQASGAHEGGWQSRGGKSLDCVRSHSAFRIFSDVQSETVYTDRVGFILFNLERSEDDGWCAVTQNEENLINPLSLELFLDRSEKELVELARKWRNERPVFVVTKKTNSTPSEIAGVAKEHAKVAESLVSFVDSNFWDDWLPWFGDSLTGKAWNSNQP